MARTSTSPLPLQRTVKKTAAQFDFASVAALHYAQAWAAHQGGRKAPLSLILRRALAVYADHLQALDSVELADEYAMPVQIELRMLKSAGQGRGALCLEADPLTEGEAQQLALERLEALADLDPLDDRWPSFGAVLLGPKIEARSVDAHAELDARVEHHARRVAARGRDGRFVASSGHNR